MDIHGKNIIGGEVSAEGSRTFAAVNPATGQELEPPFHDATDAEVNRALETAERAFEEYRRKPPQQIAEFLETVGAEIMALGDELLERANAETALPAARLAGERARTANQFAQFAQLVREGSWVDARIERARPERKPAPKPDLRRILVPIGPVAVFGASNFPLAYSVAGGDTASALAAGNPVVAKAHPAHAGTCELTMRAVQAAIRKCGMPAGVMSMVHGASNAVGLALVRHPLTRAVGFTGSLQGGRALCDAAAGRPEPIPVYAEMGSTNPVFLLPEALAQRGAEIAEGFAQSVTLGVGQFCTCPGLVFGAQGDEFEAFVGKVGQCIAQVPPGTMLHAGIRERYCAGVEERQKMPGVRVAGQSHGAAASDERDVRGTTGVPARGGVGRVDNPPYGTAQVPAVVFTTDAATFLAQPKLREEVFGPATIAVRCRSLAEMTEVARRLDGQLTASVHCTPDDLRAARTLVDLLERKAGRLIYNGFPTGVEVCPAMHHGGPYPASSQAHFTSVGTAAILRFVRPVSYQSFPPELLPPELQNRNVRGIWRLVDGELTKADC